jgi:hypothetical protein
VLLKAAARSNGATEDVLTDVQQTGTQQVVSMGSLYLQLEQRKEGTKENDVAPFQ